MDFKAEGPKNTEKYLSATWLTRKYLNFRRSRIAKTVTFWPWWQTFNSFCFKTLSSFPLFPFFLFVTQKTERVCIPLRGTVPLRGNWVWILPISSEWIGIFLTKLGSPNPSLNRSILTLVYLKFETSPHPQMHKLKLFINTYYLQVSWHDMNLKFGDQWSWSTGPPRAPSYWGSNIFQNRALLKAFEAT